MSISGLIITLQDAPLAERAIAALARDARLTLGERYGNRIVAVAETPGVDTDRALWDDLRATPGVEYVDVTFVSLDPVLPSDPSSPMKETRHDQRHE